MGEETVPSIRKSAAAPLPMDVIFSVTQGVRLLSEQQRTRWSFDKWRRVKLAVPGFLSHLEETEKGTSLSTMSQAFTLKTQKSRRKDLRGKTLQSAAVNITSCWVHFK